MTAHWVPKGCSIKFETNFTFSNYELGWFSKHSGELYIHVDGGMLARYEARRAQGVLPATFEVIYGHAWALGAPVKDKAARPISLAALRRGRGR